VTSGTVPERHRELNPIAGLTGNVRSATGAQCRSRGPCCRAKARQCTADRGQCVSAWGGTRTPAPQRRRRSRPGTGARDGQCQGDRREARSPLACCSRHRWSGHQTGHRRSGRTAPKAHHPRLASGAREGAGSMVRPWAALLLTEHSGRIASGTTGARWCAGRDGEDHHSKGLRFGVRYTGAASWTVPKAMPVSRRRAPLAIAETAD
jgi:hypothetical protein